MRKRIRYSIVLFFIFVTGGCSHQELKSIKEPTTITNNFTLPKLEVLTQYEIIGTQIYSKIINYHIYGYKPITDEDFLKNFINSLDFNHEIFLKKELNKYNKEESSIYLNLLNSGTPIITKTQKILFDRVEIIKNQIKNENFNKKAIIKMNNDYDLFRNKKEFFESEEEVILYWKNKFYNKIFDRYVQDLSDLENDKPISTNIDIGKLKNVFNKVKKELINDLNSFQKFGYKEYFSTLINSLVRYYDPHSTYFPPEENIKFKNDLKGKMNGFGFIYKKIPEGVQIFKIYPNSPASKSEMKKDDLILSLSKKNSKNSKIEKLSHPFSEYSLTKFLNNLEDYSNTIIFELKDNKKIKNISLTKKTFDKFDDNIFYSILKNGKKKNGYIKINSFYRDFRDLTNTKNVFYDFKNVLEKLKKEKIDNLTIDLRNNGGGSLIDAIYITGLFIKDGPVVQTKDLLDTIEVYEDQDKDIVYNGPLNVLINEGSASASEIMASALQDYNRAIIIGSSPHSFGKGTVQKIFELSSIPFFPNSNVDYGSLKLTMNNFYRINGESIQELGVIPDFTINDTETKINPYYIRYEKDLPFFLRRDTISSLDYEEYKNYNFNPENLQKELNNEQIKSIIDKQKQITNLKYSINIKNNLNKIIENYNKIQLLEKHIENINLFKNFSFDSHIYLTNNSDEVNSFLKENIDTYEDLFKKDVTLKFSILSFR